MADSLETIKLSAPTVVLSHKHANVSARSSLTPIQHPTECVGLRLVAWRHSSAQDWEIFAQGQERLPFSMDGEKGSTGTISLECLYIWRSRRMPRTRTDSWVEMKGFLRYGKTPCKKLTPSSKRHSRKNSFEWQVLLGSLLFFFSSFSATPQGSKFAGERVSKRSPSEFKKIALYTQ